MSNENRNGDKSSTPQNTEIGDSVLHSSLTQRASNVILKTAIANVRSGNQTTEANILLDEGAQRSFITDALASKLNITSTRTEVVHLSGFGEQKRQVRHLGSATVYVEADDGSRTNIPLDVLIVPEIALPIKNHISSVVEMKHLRGLKLAHPVSEDDMFEVNLLIGADYYWSIVGDKIVRGDGPTAVESKLGYLLSGPTHSNTDTCNWNSMLNVMVTHKTEEYNLEKFWEIESLGVGDKNENTELEKFQENYEKSSISFHDNRYFAKLPFKTEHEPLPVNKSVTLRRTENVIRRLSKEPQLLHKYGEIINEQEKRGFIEKVNPEAKPQTKLHYIPHHPVKKDSATTPIRIVYDCSCKPTQDSTSLNDCLLNVPPKLNDVTAILMRFRMNSFAVSTDIEKAFLNIGLEEEDRDVTRFFWLSNPTDPNSELTTYRFKSVLFGATCSPFILNAVLLKHLNDNCSEITEKLSKDLYVDNIVSSFNSEEELLEYFRLTRKLFADGGFNLRSWASNNKMLQKLAESEKVLDKDQLIKILGLRWDTVNDTLGFATTELCNIPKTLITKREILRQSSRIYDPLGVISPVTVRSKMLMQTLWQKQLSWDEPLPQDIVTEWKGIAKDIEDATHITIPRHYSDQVSDTDTSTTIHVFTDASMKAYGAVAYLVTKDTSTIIMARNRIAPLKQLSIPRLELMAAVIGSRLLDHITKHTGISHAILWSDSQIVLNWLNSSKTLKPFISNRIREIKELTDEFAWKYCPTNDNPADLLSRGVSAEKFKQSKLWMNGPDWITNQENWPKWNRDEAQIFSTIAEQEYVTDGCILSTVNTKQDSTQTHGISNIIDIERFSSFKKLLRIIAYVRRFVSNCRLKDRKKSTLQTDEIHKACTILIQDAQERHYSDVIRELRTNTKKHNLIKQLKLYIDEDNLIRCEGRIHNSPLDDTTKFPLLIPAKDRLTQLIVMDAHITHLHSGLSGTVTFLRQSYWIPTIRQIVKSIIRKCVNCKKVTGRSFSAPEPPPLPRNRLKEAAPFTVTGVDFTGALTVKTSDGQTRKAYICLFTCASTRAVHLEVVNNLSAETFILAFRRFSSRKSLPKTMISDNATTYIAASKQIEDLTRSPSLIEQLNNYGTTWKFIPKRAPWYGGWWERLVGITKDCIKKTLGRSLISLELLTTIVTELESILNDRPLTYVTSDPLDEDPLTPAHLLYGRRITSTPYPDTRNYEHSSNKVTHESVNKLSHMKAQIIQHFWYKWRHEYLTSLREYQRNTGKDDQTINIGDVVQVYDDTPRMKWTLAVVDKLNTGGDGIARSAIIRTKNGLTSRPITKLYPLEVTACRDSHDIDCTDNLCRKAKSDAIENIRKWTNAKK